LYLAQHFAGGLIYFREGEVGENERKPKIEGKKSFRLKSGREMRDEYKYNVCIARVSVE